MGIALPIVALAVSAASSIAGGLAARRKAEAQSGMLSRNAEIARQNAGAERLAGNQQAGVVRDQVIRTNARVVSQAAGQNLALDSGSVRDIVLGNAILGETKVQAVLNDSWRKALGYEGQADAFDIQSVEAHREGNIALVSGFLGAGAAGAKAISSFTGTTESESSMDDGAVPVREVQADWIRGNEPNLKPWWD